MAMAKVKVNAKEMTRIHKISGPKLKCFTPLLPLIKSPFSEDDILSTVVVDTWFKRMGVVLQF